MTDIRPLRALERFVKEEIRSFAFITVDCIATERLVNIKTLEKLLKAIHKNVRKLIDARQERISEAQNNSANTVNIHYFVKYFVVYHRPVNDEPQRFFTGPGTRKVRAM